jgi:D-arabinose 1-dehydrogenase-like Zn-dependent alcohol dehydrogenase
VGRVLAVGAFVTGFRPDDLGGIGCIVDSCKHCADCKEGLENDCDQMQGVYDRYGISPDRIAQVVAFGIDQPEDSAFNEFTVGPAKQPW